MKDYHSFEIPSELDKNELKQIIESEIEFNYKPYFIHGSQLIKEKFYGDRIDENSYKLWRSTEYIGSWDIKATGHFLLEIKNQGITLWIQKGWLWKVLINLSIAFIAFLITQMIPYSLIWLVIIGWIIFLVLLNLIFHFNEKSIKEDFEKLLKQNQNSAI